MKHDYNREIYSEDPLKKYRPLLALAGEAPILTKWLLVIQVVLLFLFMKPGALILSSIAGGLNIAICLYLKNLAENEKNDKFKEVDVHDMLLKRSIKAGIILMFSIANSLTYRLYVYIYSLTLGKNDPTSVAKIPWFILLIVNSLTAVFIIYLKKKRENADKLEELEETDLLEKAGITIPEIREHVNDVKLVINPETGQEVLWREDDRFVHMLILGPTGSGKTSQIIIPLINQDIQVFESGITVIEPKDDLAEKIYAMAQHYGRPAIYFNPVLGFCPSYNPLYGKEEDIIETMVTTFKMLNPDSPQYFQDINEQLIRNALTVLKRLRGNKATMVELETIVSNPNDRGRMIVQEFQRLAAPNEAIAKQNQDIASYFLYDYFEENSKLYDNCSGFRAQISKIVSNKYLRKVLNPENGKSDINFDNHLISNGVLAIATAQGKLRDLGSFLGYFLILSLQAAVFKRPKAHRPNHFLYIDEFQVYSNPGFADMLTQGRSYNVASHLATQNRALIGMGSGSTGKDFVELVSTNARNVVIFPGGNAQDAKYYEAEIGEIISRGEDVSISRPKMELLSGLGKGKGASESIKTTKKKEGKYSSNDIIYQDFGYVFYKIVKDKSLQPYDMGEIEFIPWELNKKLDKMVAENYALMMNEIDPSLVRDDTKEGILFEELQEPVAELVKLFEEKEKLELLDQREQAKILNNEIKILNEKYFKEYIIKSKEKFLLPGQKHTEPAVNTDEEIDIVMDEKRLDNDEDLEIEIDFSEDDIIDLDSEIDIIDIDDITNF